MRWWHSSTTLSLELSVASPWRLIILTTMRPRRRHRHTRLLFNYESDPLPGGASSGRRVKRRAIISLLFHARANWRLIAPVSTSQTAYRLAARLDDVGFSDIV